MRNVTLAVLGFVGLSLLLCGSGEVLAQTDTTDSRVQGTEPGDVRVGTGGSEALGTGTQPAASGADASSAELRQTVLRLQSEVAMLREDLSRVRSELASVAASARNAASGSSTAASGTGAEASSAGVGGSGQVGDAPSAAGVGAPAIQDTSGGDTTAQGSVSGGTTAQGAARGSTARSASASDRGAAVVDAIYTGTVRSVSARQLVLLDDAGQPFTVELGNQTRVLRNGQRISAQELKKGTRVRATVDMLSGHNQAKEVTTLPSK